MKIAFTLNQLVRFGKVQAIYEDFVSLLQGYQGLSEKPSPIEAHRFVFVTEVFTVYTDEDTGVKMISIRRNVFNYEELENVIFARMHYELLEQALAQSAYQEKFDFKAVKAARKAFVDSLDSIELNR